MIHWFVFVLCRIFDFRKIYFWIFLMIEFKFFNRMGSIRKSIKNPYLKKKNFSSYHGFFVINKNVLFFKAYNSQTKRSIFSRKIMIMQNINSYNLEIFESILSVSFWEKNWKIKKMIFVCPTIAGVKLTTALKFLVEVGFG